jgi:hypothetical protein
MYMWCWKINELFFCVHTNFIFYNQEIKLGKITQILVQLNMVSNKYRLQIILIVFCIKNTMISKCDVSLLSKDG